MAERSKGELAFIDQMTRKLLVEWGDCQIQTGSLTFPEVKGEDLRSNPYVEHALAKAFLTKREPLRLTAKGWAAAASFLKR